VNVPELTGGCLCGGVRFELTEAPLTAGYCHCTRCQRRTGAASSAQARIDGPGIRPSWRAYVAYAAVWEAIPDDGLGRFSEGRPPERLP
jgi:hypothetical protein